MIVFSSLQIRRGVRVLLDNATATINPAKRSVWWGKRLRKSTLLSLLKNEISADGGSMTFPGNWQLAWVNQETPALPQPAIDYVIDGDREYRQLEAAPSRLTNATTVMLSPPSTVSWTPSTLDDPFARRQPAARSGFQQ